MSSDAWIGSIVHGKYRVVRRLGEGGMGAVYEAVQLDLDRRVALKVPLAALSEDPKCVERFRREAMAAAKLMHPNIPQILEFMPGPPLAIAMELLHGTSLVDLLEQGRMPAARAVAIAAQIASALATAHEVGVVHRDLKPGNVFLVPVAGGELAMLLDFGVAKLTESQGYSRLTDSGVLVGTPRYASPEQIVAKDVDGRADIYSLGVLLYGMLSGRPPFTSSGAQLLIDIQTREPPSLAELVPDLPIELVKIVERAMKKAPSDRFSSAREMVAALEPYLPRPGAMEALELQLPLAPTGPALSVVELELPDAREQPTKLEKKIAREEPAPPAKKRPWGCAIAAAGVLALACALASCPVYCMMASDSEPERAVPNDLAHPLALELEPARTYLDADGDWIVTARLTVTNPRSNEEVAIVDTEDIESDFTSWDSEWTFPDHASLVPGQRVYGDVCFFTSERPSELVVSIGDATARAPVVPRPGVGPRSSAQ